MATDESLPFEKSWSNIRLINRGEFGEEIHEVFTDRKVTCAAKTIRLPIQLGGGANEDAKEAVLAAVESLRHLCTLRHENIIRFYDITLHSNISTVAVLMELVAGKSLEEFINKTALHEDKIRQFSRQVCSALDYLHNGSPVVIHRQINCYTIMISPDGSIAKLIDFALAIRLIGSTPHHISTNMRGDPHFMAPELFLADETEQSLYCCASDVWAFGCTIYQMATGARPNADCSNMMSIARRVLKKGSPPLPGAFSEQMRDFYRQCIISDRFARASARTLTKHRFICDEPQEQAASSEKNQPQLDEQSVVKAEETPLEYYKSSPRIQGLCLVINIAQYSETSRFPDRLDAKDDVDRIESTFRNLKFRIEKPDGTSSQEIWRTLQNIASSAELHDHACFLCFIMAHGTKGSIISSDGEEIDIRDIVARFRQNQCSGLKDKPKLFFIQTSCLPDDLDDSCLDSDQTGDNSFKLREPDFLIRSGIENLRPSFVQTLCDVLVDEAFSIDHVESVIAEVNRRLKLPRLQKGDLFCQTNSEVSSSLSKALCLNPSGHRSLPENPNDWSPQQLTEQCSSQSDASQTYGPMDQTLLIISAIKDRDDLITQLLQSASNEVISARDVQGMTAISWAAVKGHSRVLDAFEKAFSADSETLKQVVNTGNHLKQTPIILAAKNHQTAVLKQLNRMGADLDSKDSMDFSALTYAAKSGFEDTVSQLLRLNANPKLLDYSGNSPLIWAARCNHLGVVKLLGDQLKDVGHWEHKGERRMNAQEWAKSCEHYDCAGLIQDIIRTLASETTTPTTFAVESGGNGGGTGSSGGSPSNPNDGSGQRPDESNDSGGQAGSSDGAQGGPPTNADTANQYSMTRSSRGIAIIINIIDFPHSPHLRRRDGSREEIQQHELYLSFQRLGFDCKQYENVGSGFFINLQNVDCTEADYENADAFLLCIMSHGEQGYVYAFDGVRVSLDGVFGQFRMRSALLGKPKIFIVQACRDVPEDRFIARQVGQFNSRRHEDCLYIYSAVKGNCSFRHPLTGGLFTGALRHCILNEFDIIHGEFVALLCKVIRRVFELSAGQQVACFKSTLQRLLRFPPVRGQRAAT